MSLSSRTNRWASRVIIILQLVTWNAVGIVLLHRGVSTLRRRILETSNVVEAGSPTNLESIVSTVRDGSEYDLSTQQQLIGKNVEIIIQIDPDRLSRHGDRNLSGLSATRSERLKDTFEIVSEGQRSTLFLADHLVVPTTVRGTPSPRLNNHLTEVDLRTDDRPEDKDVTGKISRIVRDRQHILSRIINGLAESTDMEKDVTSNRSKSIPREEEEEEEEEDLDLAENMTRAMVRETSSTSSEKADDDQFTVWTDKSNVRFSRLNEDGATTAVALVAIGAIMLFVGPIVIILRILDERRQARKLIALPASVREDLPPTYEQAVLMDEAPRYSTLALNYDRTPPPSPTLSSSYTFRDAVAS